MIELKKSIRLKNSIRNQKKIYLIIIGLAVISLIVGILFLFMLSKENISYIQKNIGEYFSNIGSENSTDLFLNTFLSNLIYVLVIWVLGLSVVGLTIIVSILLFKFFTFGLSISSIISTYGFSGIIKLFINIFPHELLFLITLILVSFYGISFCIKLFNYLFFRRLINFKEVMNKYTRILIIAILCVLIVSLYKGYIMPILLK